MSGVYGVGAVASRPAASAASGLEWLDTTTGTRYYSDGVTWSSVLSAASNAAPVFNVTDAAYGAAADETESGTSTHDDSTAVQAAVNAAIAAGRGIVYFPALCRCDTLITVNGANVVLRGNGWNSGIRSRSTTGALLISTADTASVRARNGVEDMMVQYVGAGSYGVKIADGSSHSNAIASSQMCFRRAKIKGAAGTSHGLWLVSSWCSNYHDLYLPGGGGDAIRLESSSNNQFFGVTISALESGGATWANGINLTPQTNASSGQYENLTQQSDLNSFFGLNVQNVGASGTNAGIRIGPAFGTKTVLGATNASPIVVNVAAHGFATLDSITVAGVLGNTAANGTWTITRVDADHFSLNGSTGNGAYTSGGTAGGQNTGVSPARNLFSGGSVEANYYNVYVEAGISTVFQRLSCESASQSGDTTDSGAHTDIRVVAAEDNAFYSVRGNLKLHQAGGNSQAIQATVVENHTGDVNVGVSGGGTAYGTLIFGATGNVYDYGDHTVQIRTTIASFPGASQTIAMTGGTFTTPTINQPTLTLQDDSGSHPTAAGRLTYHGSFIYWGDIAATHTAVDAETSQAITGVKTMSAPVLNNPQLTLQDDSGSHPTAAGRLTYHGSFLYYGDGSAGHTAVDAETNQAITGQKTMVSPAFTTSAILVQTTANYTVQWNNPGAARTLTIPDPLGADTFAFLNATQTLAGKTLTTPTINQPTLTLQDDSGSHPTAAGRLTYHGNFLYYGDIAATHTVVDDVTAQTISGAKTFSNNMALLDSGATKTFAFQWSPITGNEVLGITAARDTSAVFAQIAFLFEPGGGGIGFYTGASGSSALAARIFKSGGVVVGSPTGGDKGAGSINAVTVWRNGTSLDKVFEPGYRMLTIPQMRRYYERHSYLPTLRTPSVHQAGSTDVGALGDALWETAEVHARYIAELDKRLAALEAAP